MKKKLFVVFVCIVIHADFDNHYIQNRTIIANEYFGSSPVSIGYDVTSSIPYGNVSIEQGATLIVGKTSGVTIKNGFECKNGAEFVVQ